MDEADTAMIEDTVEALEAYGCDGGPFRGDPPTYEIGADTGWRELRTDLHERAQTVRNEAGDDAVAYEMEKLIGRERLDVYDAVLEEDHDYTVSVLDDPQDIREVHDAVDSCIAGDDQRAQEFAEDAYTVVAGIERDGDQRGYLRAFLLEDDEQQPFLGLDALEVPDHQHERYSRVIQAGGLALCHIAAEAGVDRVIGRDDRAGYGLRQAFSSTAEEVVFEKRGAEVFSHGFHPATDGTTGYRLWEDPESIRERSVEGGA